MPRFPTSGLSASWVAMISSDPPPVPADSHTQPEPNWPVPAVTNSLLSFSSPPKPSMAWVRSPCGDCRSGVMQVQKKAWFQAWAALLNSFFGVWFAEVVTTSSSDPGSWPACSSISFSVFT